MIDKTPPVETPRRRGWHFKKAEGFGSPARVIVNTVLIFLLSQILAVFILSFVVAAHHPGRTNLDIFSGSTLSQFFYVLLAEGGAVLGVYWLVRRRKIKFSEIGLGRYPGWKDLKWAAMGAVVFYAALIVGSILLSVFVPQNEINKQQDVGFNTLVSSMDKVLAFAALVILPPLGEETLVRGYLYSGLRKTWKFWPALLVTSLLFGLAHLDGGSGGSLVIAAALDTFILSIVLVYVRQYSGALYAGMLIHATNNLIAFGIHFK